MKQQGISKLDLKRQNRMQILNIIKQYGPTARIDLAVKLQITRAAVTIITNSMIEQGILIEVGEQRIDSDKIVRGRKKMLLDINYNYTFALGIYIDKHYVAIGLSTLSGDVLDKRITCIDGVTIQSTAFDFIKAGINELLSGNCLKEQDIIGVGIAISPEAYQFLDIIQTSREIDYTAFGKQFAKISSLNVTYINSIKSIALANIDFDKEKYGIVDNVMLIQYGDYFYSTIISKNNVMRNDRTESINNYNFCYEINGKLEYQFLKDILSPTVIKQKVKSLFSKEQTPELFHICEGSLDNINLACLVKCSDKAVLDLLEEIKILFISFILNILSLVHAKRLILHSFNEDERIFLQFICEKIKDEIKKYNNGLITISKIDHNQMFLGGCVVATREFFYDKGGF